jgi:hypothetical protein
MIVFFLSNQFFLTFVHSKNLFIILDCKSIILKNRKSIKRFFFPIPIRKMQVALQEKNIKVERNKTGKNRLCNESYYFYVTLKFYQL